MFDLASVVDTLAFETLSLDRRAGEYVNGIWVNVEALDPPTFRASVQPARGRDLESLPEGKRGLQTIKIFTSFGLQLGSQPDGVLPDVVTWKGVRYEVATVEPWESYGYVQALATREEPQL